MAQAAPPGMMTTVEMCTATGCSFRQLDYWTRAGVLVPDQLAAGSGQVRGWSPRQIAAVRAITMLSRYLAVVTMARVATVAAMIEAGMDGDWAVIADDIPVVTNTPGRFVHAADSAVVVRFRNTNKGE